MDSVSQATVKVVDIQALLADMAKLKVADILVEAMVVDSLESVTDS